MKLLLKRENYGSISINLLKLEGWGGIIKKTKGTSVFVFQYDLLLSHLGKFSPMRVLHKEPGARCCYSDYSSPKDTWSAVNLLAD